MIHSMTGFGRSGGRILDREVTVEVRTVNNRFRDIVVRIPKTYASLEDSIKKKVAARLYRGRVDVWFQVDEPAGRVKNLKLDMDLACALHGLMQRLKDELNLAADVKLSDLLQFRDIIGYEDEEMDLEDFMAGFDPLLSEALDKVIRMRQSEGESIAVDFKTRLESMNELLAGIESRRGRVLEEFKEKLEARLKNWTNGVELDEGRLVQEVAYLVDRSDITEEVVRLGSHFEQMANLISRGGEVGRRLEFLLQEMNREVNTIGSKSSDVSITNAVVDLKTELEKLREQVQNVE